MSEGSGSEAGAFASGDALRWLARQVGYHNTVTPLAGDVSQRRYARVAHGGASSILALYPPSLGGVYDRFLRTTSLLSEVGARVPRVLAHDRTIGVMLLEDQGPRTVYELRDRGWEQVMGWLDDAARQCTLWRALPLRAVSELNEPLGERVMTRELAQTRELLLVPALRRDPGLASELDDYCDRVVHALAGGPQQVCHRDLMARNLVPVGARAVAVLDHQDLRQAPSGYDLASLWNDSVYPPSAYIEEAGRAFRDVDAAQFGRCVVQRTFKIVGTFLRFAQLGSARHLRLVRPSLRRGLSAMGRLLEPDGRALARALRRPLRDACDRLC